MNENILSSEMDDFIQDIEETKKLRENLEKHKLAAEKKYPYGAYNDESRAVATAITFFRDETTKKSLADVALELNLMYPNLTPSFNEQEVKNLKSLSYLHEDGKDIINLDKRMDDINHLEKVDEKMEDKNSKTSLEDKSDTKNTDNNVKIRKQ